MRFHEIKVIREAGFDTKRKEKHEVSFRQSVPTDPHIQKIVKKISAETGVPVADLMKEMSQDMDKIAELKKYSLLLYDTIALNNAENAAFYLIKNSKKPVDYSKTKFNEGIFKILLKRILRDHKAFFPLKSPTDVKRIDELTVILVPTNKKEIMKFNNIDTAAATPNGEFIFNRDFMSQLLYYGEAIDIQPTSAYYECNGGPFPNNYCYIEFLILHEILHYAYGDFASANRLGQYTHTAHNWASDFRSNYFLVKSGYTQLPCGLFSNDLNFDRKKTSNYEKLIKVVDEEMKKLPKTLKAWIESKGQHDKHGDEKSENVPWEPKIGEIVIHNKEGSFGRITQIMGDGTYETDPVSMDEVKARYPGIQVG